jgi:hypothetical protein
MISWVARHGTEFMQAHLPLVFAAKAVIQVRFCCAQQELHYLLLLLLHGLVEPLT